MSMSGRPEWYDRNPLAVGALYESGALAPHATTQRFIYTVPAGRRAVIHSALAAVMRDTAAAPLGSAQALVTTDVSARFTAPQLRDNTVGAVAQQVLAPGAILPAGGVVEGYTTDNSTGGTCLFWLSFSATEFDA